MHVLHGELVQFFHFFQKSKGIDLVFKEEFFLIYLG